MLLLRSNRGIACYVSTGMDRRVGVAAVGRYLE